jgi:hypothetical protein
MNFYDILLAKKLAGGGGGGGGNAETATIEISITNSTPTITSGEFPEWCTAENSDYIFGKVKLWQCITGESEWYGEYGIQSVKLNQQGITGVVASASAGLVMTTGLTPIIGTKLEYVGDFVYGIYESGTVTVTLVYVPAE